MVNHPSPHQFVSVRLRVQRGFMIDETTPSTLWDMKTLEAIVWDLDAVLHSYGVSAEDSIVMITPNRFKWSMRLCAGDWTKQFKGSCSRKWEGKSPVCARLLSLLRKEHESIM